MKRVLLPLLTALVLTGCFKTIGQDLSTGAVEGLLTKDSALNAMTTRLAGQIVSAARDSLVTPSLNRQLTSTIDSIIAHFGIGATKELTALRDSLLNRYLVDLVDEIRGAAIGNEARAELGLLRDELIGRKASQDLQVLMATLLGDTTQARIAGLRNELLGPATSSQIDTIISHAISQIASDYRDKLQPIIREEGGWLQKNATTLAWTAGGIVALLIGVCVWAWTQKAKYAKMLNVITYQIHDMDDQQEYDELTERISKKSKEAGLEADLRNILKKRGLLEDQKPEPAIQVA